MLYYIQDSETGRVHTTDANSPLQAVKNYVKWQMKGDSKSSKETLSQLRNLEDANTFMGDWGLNLFSIRDIRSID
jgi:hypothetical protein